MLESGNKSLMFRKGSAADSYTIFKIFENSLADLLRRLGFTDPVSADDSAALAKMWEERRSLYNHMARTANQYWIAEEDGEAVGYARSILRDGVQELTELFILPGSQSAGLGRALIKRAFPQSGARFRSIISSPDIRAQSLYMKSGVYPRFQLYYLWRKPEKVNFKNDLEIRLISDGQNMLNLLADVDVNILDHRRDSDHQWLQTERQGYLYLRDGRPVGYGYFGKRTGPVALLDDNDFPAILAHAESAAAGKFEHFGLEIPAVNQVALDYLLSRDFRIDSFVATLMTDQPFGNFERYIVTSPPFIL